MLTAIAATVLMQTTPTRDDAVRDYMLCVRAAAVRIEPSGSDPDDVAKAATFVCLEKEVLAFNAALRDPSSNQPDQLRATALYWGAAQTVLARLCRTTSDCEMAPVSDEHLPDW